MKAVESSLSYRSLRAASRRLGVAARSSMIGRTTGRAARATGPVFADSRVFGTGRIAPAAGDKGQTPHAVSAFARPTLAAQAALAGGAPGRVLHAAGAAVPFSAFAGGEWVRLVGAGMVGLGVGMARSRPVAAAVVIVIGVLLAVAGPVALAAVRSSVVGRTLGLGATARAGRESGHQAGVPSSWVPARRVTWVAMALCVVGGALAGAAPGESTRAVVAFALGLVALAVVLWRPEAILLVVAAFPWMDWAVRTTLGGLGPLWDDALLVVCLALLAWSVLVLGREAPRTVPLALPLLLMFAVAVASIVIGRVRSDAGLYALRVLFEPILFYFVGFLFPKNVRWVRAAVAVFIVSCTALAVHGVFQYVTGAPMPANWVDVTETNIAVRAYSVVQNPNVLGGLLAMGALVTGSLALSRAFDGGRRLLLALACAVQLLGLAVTFSRGAWLGFAIGLLATVVLAYRRYLVAVVAAAIVAWFTVPRVFIERLLFAFTATYAERSNVGLGRAFRWDAAFGQIAEHPVVGAGLGTFGGTTAFMFGYWALWVDNFYLQLAAEGGLLLLAVFLWLLLRGAKGLVRGHRVAGDPYLKALTAGVFGSFLAIVVADAFEADWETLSLAVPFWFLAGLATSAALEAAGSSSRVAAEAPPGSTDSDKEGGKTR